MTQIRRVYLALSVFLALSLLLVVLVIFAVNNLPLLHPAARPVVGANTHPPGAAGASVAKANGVSATKSTTSLTGALTGAMSMTGTITLAGDAATAYTVVDAFQALPAGSFYQGTYTISFTCSPGTGASTTETIGGAGRRSASVARLRVARAGVLRGRQAARQRVRTQRVMTALPEGRGGGLRLFQRLNTPTARFALRVGALLGLVGGAYHYSLITLLNGVSLQTPLAYLGLVPLVALLLVVVYTLAPKPA